ncbi:ECF-type sigma factor [Paucibacter sp. APW11]|uniref:ECF-type sigma factor n=1 Tax=Roseateles aquae TaxID=3077235 RepID=A0ABU3P7U9_9BURK|nr:ECF-type sigma factor [Paucibacter sp. APW11]MDT8998295.1 ECF-type sigma factor [Paucibacter sp. APW11]
MNSGVELTVLLEQARAGDGAAGDQAFRLIYPELRRIARARLHGHQVPTLLDTEALVHECFIRFVSAQLGPLHGRKHFYSLASQAMRHILIDHVRRRQAQRHGGDWQRQTWDTRALGATAAAESLIDVDAALVALQQLDPALAELVELRFYGGYTEAETAEALGLSERTVRRQWAKARAFLLAELQG